MIYNADWTSSGQTHSYMISGLLYEAIEIKIPTRYRSLAVCGSSEWTSTQL